MPQYIFQSLFENEAESILETASRGNKPGREKALRKLY